MRVHVCCVAVQYVPASRCVLGGMRGAWGLWGDGVRAAINGGMSLCNSAYVCVCVCA